MKAFKIAHLSDLHLTALDNDRRSEPKFPHQRLKGMNVAFEKVLQSGNVQKSDVILITGDITDKGDLPAWQRFNQMLKEANVRNKTHIVIGNHDICGLKAFFRASDKRKLREADISRVKRSLTAISFGYDYPWVKMLNDEIALFGIDSNNAGNYGPLDNAIGRIGQFQLEAFARLLWKYKDAPIKIVALHHSPNIPGRATAIKRKGKADPEWVRYTHEIPREERWALQFMCVAHGVRLILHGHLHEDEDRRVNGIRIIGAPSTTQPTSLEKNKHYQFNRYTVRKSGEGKYRVEKKACKVGCQ